MADECFVAEMSVRSKIGRHVRLRSFDYGYKPAYHDVAVDANYNWVHSGAFPYLMAVALSFDSPANRHFASLKTVLYGRPNITSIPV